MGTVHRCIKQGHLAGKEAGRAATGRIHITHTHTTKTQTHMCTHRNKKQKQDNEAGEQTKKSSS